MQGRVHEIQRLAGGLAPALNASAAGPAGKLADLASPKVGSIGINELISFCVS
jgi:hypothetical protein